MSRSERAPFLGDNDHDDDYDSSDYRKLPANHYFKRPLRILSGLTSLLSFAGFGLLIATYVLIVVGPFGYTYRSRDTVRDLAICLFTNIILTTPSVFFALPIIIPLVFNFVMTIVIFVFTGVLFADGAPDSGFCYRYRRYDPSDPYAGPLPETRQCKDARKVVMITMFVSGLVGIVVGLLLITLTLLRLVAIFKTKFWEGKKFPSVGGGLGGSGWSPNGFTVQFTMRVIRQEDSVGLPAADAAGRSGPKPANVQAPEGERLIET